MPTLMNAIDSSFPLKNLLTEISPNDTMFEPKDDEDEAARYYLNVGRSALAVFNYAIGHGLITSENIENILDLPCGHGRVARVLRAKFPDARLTVCDLDRDAVDFCASRLAATGVYSAEDFDAFDLGDRFDLIWVGSLITHFNSEKTVKFLRCMQRHLAQDGLLVISSHGEKLRTSYEPSHPLRKQYDISGYGYVGRTAEYGTSLISRHWLEGFFAGEKCGIISFLDAGWANWHDVLIVCEKGSSKWDGVATVDPDRTE